jgi:hypothetical protein
MKQSSLKQNGKEKTPPVTPTKTNKHIESANPITAIEINKKTSRFNEGFSPS